MSSAQSSPFGFGLQCPLRMTSSKDFATASGEALVRSDLEELVNIEPGDILWRPSLGTGLGRLRHRMNTQALADLARVQVQHAVARYDSRVRLLGVVSPPPTRDAPSRREFAIVYQPKALGAAAGDTQTVKAAI